MLRNHGTELEIAIVFMGVGALVWLLATVDKHRVEVGVAGTLTLIGIWFGYHAAINAAEDTEQPTVDVSLDRRTLAVRGRATVANLGSDESLAVAVRGAIREKGRWRFTRLSRSVGGPDSDGNAETEIAVDLPSGRFDAIGVRAFTGERAGRCGPHARADEDDEDDGGTACQLIRLPQHPNPPQLAAAWSGEGEGRTLAIRLRTSGTGVRDIRRRPLVLRVVGQDAEATDRLYRAVFLPRALGELRRAVQVSIPPGVWRVCAQARFAVRGKPLGRLRCPLHGTGAASVELRVPESYE